MQVSCLEKAFEALQFDTEVRPDDVQLPAFCAI
jgi:hypothetical protein